MTRTITRLALVGALVVATPALAEHPTSAWTQQPSYWQSNNWRQANYWTEVQEAAHRLDQAARRVHRSAERFAHHGSSAEQRGLVALHELAERADHFHNQVERYRQDPRHLQGDFRSLQDAYDRATWSFTSLHAFRNVSQDFGEVVRAMDRLTSLYATWMAPWGGAWRPGSNSHGVYGYPYGSYPYGSPGTYGQPGQSGLYFQWNW